jgi:hypothetical protein
MPLIRFFRPRKKDKMAIKRRLVLIGSLGVAGSFYLLYYGIGRLLFYRSVHYGNLLDYVISGFLPVCLGALVLILIGIIMVRGVDTLLSIQGD